MWQELRPGDPGRIGPYRLRGLLGTGGMGRVFLGAAADGQLAAVKVIRLDLAADPEFRARFRREVDVGPASDIFSLGAVLAFAATGEGPFGTGSAPTMAYRVVYHEPGLDRVPVEVRGLIQRCLAKDPTRRPTARDLVLGAGAAQRPGTVTPTVVERRETSSATRTVTSARLAPDVMPVAPAPAEPGRHRGRRERRLARPLVIGSMVVGLMAASAAGGVALASSAHQTTGAQSGQAKSGRVSSPATSAPAVLTPATSPTAVTVPSASASASATATPTTTAPSTVTSSPGPAASSSPTPATSGSASASPAPTGPSASSPAAP